MAGGAHSAPAAFAGMSKKGFVLSGTSETNAICFPSGDHDGAAGDCGALVCLAVAPASS